MDQKFTRPVEQIALARILVSGHFEFVRGNYELPVLFFYLTEKVVQFRRVLGLQKALDRWPARNLAVPSDSSASARSYPLS